MQRRRRMPTDPSKLVKIIIDIATGQAPPEPPDQRNPAAVALNRLGASKGGHARAKKLSDRRKRTIARKAARVRWTKKL